MNAMPREVIAAVQAAGFDVYMRNETDSWLHFTDGQRIGYLENNRLEGLKLSTVHIPNTSTGTGYSLEGGLITAELTKDKLSEAFYAPSWALNRDREASRPWANWEAFAKSSVFNGAYHLVALVEA